MSDPILQIPLTAIEWAALSRDRTPYGRRSRCCPICGGIDPSDSSRTEFPEGLTGHRPNCQLAKVLS